MGVGRPQRTRRRAVCRTRTAAGWSVSQLIGPFLFTLTFAWFIGANAPFKLPGAPFYLASALLLLALVIALRATKAARSEG